MKPENGLDGVRIVAERIRKALTMTIDDVEPPITVAASIGVALFPADAGNREELLCKADKAMYEAKNAGRNCIVFACELPES